MEIWLGTLLNCIRNTVHSVVRRANQAINDPGFQVIDFENVFPAQIGILGLQMLWTRDSEDALTNAKSDKKVEMELPLKNFPTVKVIPTCFLYILNSCINPIWIQAMQNMNQRFIDMLKILIDQTTHELTKYERTKYETLITIHVHQRDIFDDLVTFYKSHIYVL